jgi:hypothetical protein
VALPAQFTPAEVANLQIVIEAGAIVASASTQLVTIDEVWVNIDYSLTTTGKQAAFHNSIVHLLTR